MKSFCKLAAIAVCVALLLSLVSCVDFGAGENEDDLKKYFSGVYLLSKNGLKKYSIEDFNKNIDLESMEIPVLEGLGYNEFCYIGFKVDNQYTISLSEFAFFAKTQSGKGMLDLEFYVVDKMPTSIKNDEKNNADAQDLDSESSLTTTETVSESETEIYDEDVFDPSNKFHTYSFPIDEEWNSVLLEFGTTQTVNPGQYIVVRIKNNCYWVSNGNGEQTDQKRTPSVSFTFNYLLFHITDAHKK